MSRSGRDLDEDDVRVRPGRRKSRPRSKDRPSFDQALPGTVVTVDRGRFTVDMDDGDEVLAVKAREIGRKGVVVGDRVGLMTDARPGTESLGRIVRVDKRSTVLRRTADDDDPVERVIVANADQLAVVVATVDPEPRLGFIDRAFVAAIDAGIEPLLIITKADLADPQSLIDAYAALDVVAIPVARGEGKRPREEDLQVVLDHLSDRTSVFVGHSGVGKSTLVNALVPGAERATGHVNAVTGRGRHTSTSALALRLPRGGWIVDTPGVRSFGLAHVTPDAVISAFDDLAPGLDSCPRGCTHDEDECALDAFVAGDPHLSARLDSLRRLIRSRLGSDDASTNSSSEEPGNADD